MGCWNPINVDLTEGWEWDDVRDGFRMDDVTLQRVKQHKRWKEEQLVQRLIGAGSSGLAGQGNDGGAAGSVAGA
jgi:hypothetical protein